MVTLGRPASSASLTRFLSRRVYNKEGEEADREHDLDVNVKQLDRAVALATVSALPRMRFSREMS